MKEILSLTAYRCRICKLRKNQNLLNLIEEEDVSVNLLNLLQEYFQHINKPQIAKYFNRTIVLKDRPQYTKIGGLTKVSIFSQAGKFGEDFTVLEHDKNQRVEYDGTKNSAVYSHKTYCFIDESTQNNVFVFYRYGISGCKTAFQETFNEFLLTKGLRAHFDLSMSSMMFDDPDRCVPEKLSLLTSYVPVSTDAADNLKKRQRKQKAQELILYLDAPNTMNLRTLFKNCFNRQITLDELREVGMRDNLPSDFDDAKLTVRFGKTVRKINLKEFKGLIAEYDITNKVEYYEGSSRYTEESFNKVLDEYGLSFFVED